MPYAPPPPRRTRAQARRLGCKTAAEWYLLDRTRTILDPDGWRNSWSAWWEYWNLPITKNEYESRAGMCTCAKYDPNRREHFMRPNPPMPRLFM